MEQEAHELQDCVEDKEVVLGHVGGEEDEGADGNAEENEFEVEDEGDGFFLGEAGEKEQEVVRF